MKIIVTGRHIEMTPALKAYAEERIQHLARYSSLPTEASVILTVEKYRHQAEITFNVNGQSIQAKEETAEMYASIDQAVEKIERQLKKYKDRLHDHRSYPEPSLEDSSRLATSNTVRLTPEKRALGTMTPDAAAIELQRSEHGFVLFRHTETSCVNVVYRKLDGTVGWIEPSP